MRSAASPGWRRIGLAVLLAGAVPTILSYSVLLAVRVLIGPVAPFRPVYILFHFVVHLLPLPLGIWAASKWPGQHTKGHIGLGVLAGIIEAATIWLFVFTIAPLVWPLDLRWEDLAGLIATATLFTAGGLFGDLIERWKASGDREANLEQAPSDRTTLALIQSLGPAFLALIGTMINALVALM